MTWWLWVLVGWSFVWSFVSFTIGYTMAAGRPWWRRPGGEAVTHVNCASVLVWKERR